jgi:hypothetical protein
VIAVPHASNSTTAASTLHQLVFPTRHQWTASPTCNTRSCNATVVDCHRHDFHLSQCLSSVVDTAPSTAVRVSTRPTSSQSKTIRVQLGRQHQHGHSTLDPIPSFSQPCVTVRVALPLRNQETGLYRTHYIGGLHGATSICFCSSVRPSPSICDIAHH